MLSNFSNMRPPIHILLAQSKPFNKRFTRVSLTMDLLITLRPIFLVIMRKKFGKNNQHFCSKQTWILSMFEVFFNFQLVSLMSFRAATSCLFAATYNIVVTLSELSGVTTNYIQGITLSEASLHFFVGLYLRKGSFPRSLYFLPIQTGFNGSCRPESATNPIGHSQL